MEKGRGNAPAFFHIHHTGADFNKTVSHLPNL